MSNNVIGIDLAKSIFHVHAADRSGRKLWAKKLSREKLTQTIENHPKCLIAMEACASANFWARKFQAMGHEVRLISPQYVKPFVKTNKNDFNDAEAIIEAVLRPTMRFVTPKSERQQDIQSIHRVRSRLVRTRTAIKNEIHGILLEYGYALPLSVNKFFLSLAVVLDEAPLAGALKEMLGLLREEYEETDKKINRCEAELKKIASDPQCQRIMGIPGVGMLTATAILAVPNLRDFKNGREFSASLGLVPRQKSTGGRHLLLGISKRGDTYLRTLLVHGSRSVLRTAANSTDRLSKWGLEKYHTRGANRAAVALANKRARIIWAVATKGEDYRQ